MKIFYSIFLALLFTVTKAATPPDEGMWLPILLGNNQADMQAHGSKLTAEQIYSINNSSITDAIVWFGGGCTGEVVSDKGLVFTNHHCGYGNITALSTPTDNILDNGFWAKSISQERPAKGLSVAFVIRIQDVTARVLDGISGVAEENRAAKLTATYKKLTDEAIKGTGYEALVREFFRGNSYYLFVLERYNDVRLVGTPPQNIGKFGGDVDNWMWPRHTGDFSIFRIYANKENKPAAYSTENIPYTPKHSLPVSIQGVKQGDYAMIMGFPGRTNRYEFANGIDLAVNSVNPAIVDFRNIRLTSWKEEMDKDVAVRLELASTYASISNYWKYFIGQTEQLKHLKVYEQKSKEEVEFNNWAKGKNEYATIISDVDAAYKNYKTIAVQRTYINEGLMANNIASIAAIGLQFDTMLANGHMEDAIKLGEKYIPRITGTMTQIKSADKKIMAQVLEYYYNNCRPADRAPYINTILSKSKGKTTQEKFTNYAEMVYAKSIFADSAKLVAFLKKPNLKVLKKDPGYQYVKGFMTHYYENFKPAIDAFGVKNTALARLYVKGLMEMQPNRTFYSDANSSLRVTYGNVQDYEPKDAVKFGYMTTLDGVMEKYNPNDPEFTIPKELIDLYNKKDFGRYAMADGKLPVGFITNNDITGGNSGSPVINANGELIGLAFDGNWEAMSGDIYFDKKYKRTICVDVRYVLFCIEKLGGAPNIINELKIVQ